MCAESLQRDTNKGNEKTVANRTNCATHHYWGKLMHTCWLHIRFNNTPNNRPHRRRFLFLHRHTLIGHIRFIPVIARFDAAVTTISRWSTLRQNLARYFMLWRFITRIDVCRSWKRRFPFFFSYFYAAMVFRAYIGVTGVLCQCWRKRLQRKMNFFNNRQEKIGVQSVLSL